MDEHADGAQRGMTVQLEHTTCKDADGAHQNAMDDNANGALSMQGSTDR